MIATANSVHLTTHAKKHHDALKYITAPHSRGRLITLVIIGQ